MIEEYLITGWIQCRKKPREIEGVKLIFEDDATNCYEDCERVFLRGVNLLTREYPEITNLRNVVIWRYSVGGWTKIGIEK